MRTTSPQTLMGAVSAIALGVAALPGSAIAQDAETDTDASNKSFELIFVTSQKRTESLNDVPVAVTAFSGQALEELSINDASDLIAITAHAYLTHTLKAIVNGHKQIQIKDLMPWIYQAIQ